MGYNIPPAVGIKTYTPSDDVIVNSLRSLHGTEGQATYEPIKYIYVGSDIGATSLFRFKFKLFRGATACTAYGKIYRNGVAIGTERSTAATTPGDEFTEDIVSTTWRVGDRIELWTHVQAGAGKEAYCSEFRICGVGSEFILGAGS